MKTNHYKNIFKSTLLFGAVQAHTLLIKVITNKLAAYLLGPAGIGLVSLVQNIILNIKTVASLGVSQSAVRDISATQATNDRVELAMIVKATETLLVWTAFGGSVVALALSPFIVGLFSQQPTTGFDVACIAAAVFFIVLWEGKLAILKGVRSMRYLAQANILSALASLIVVVPLYYTFHMAGIIAAAAGSAIVAYFVTNHFRKKLAVPAAQVPLSEVFRFSVPMIKTGVSLSAATVLSQASTLAVTAYVARASSTYTLGLYTAGTMVMVGYFSAVITALSTDYYPRISAYKHRNDELQSELNRQSVVTILICAPLVVIFLVFLPQLIVLLFSASFLPALDFARIGIPGVIITIFSNQIDLILVVKGNSRLYLGIAAAYRVVEVGLSIALFNFFGLDGLGIAVTVMAILHAAAMIWFAHRLYSIRYNRQFVMLCLFFVAIVVISMVCGEVADPAFKYSAGSVLMLAISIFCYFYARHSLGLGSAVNRSERRQGLLGVADSESGAASPTIK